MWKYITVQKVWKYISVQKGVAAGVGFIPFALTHQINEIAFHIALFEKLIDMWLHGSQSE